MLRAFHEQQHFHWHSSKHLFLLSVSLEFLCCPATNDSNSCPPQNHLSHQRTNLTYFHISSVKQCRVPPPKGCQNVSPNANRRFHRLHVLPHSRRQLLENSRSSRRASKFLRLPNCLQRAFLLHNSLRNSHPASKRNATTPRSAYEIRVRAQQDDGF